MRLLRHGWPCLFSNLVCAAVLLLATAAGAATITVVNLDGPGEGFNDPTLRSPVGGNTGTTIGEQRLIAFQAAADRWGARLASNVEILIGAEFNPLTCSAFSAVLGQAGAESVFATFPGAPLANTWYAGPLANSLAGFDLDIHENDIGAEFNSDLDDNDSCLLGTSFYYGLDGNAGLDADFFHVVLHEIAHGLGFASLVNLSTGQKSLGFDDAFMRNLEDHSTGKTFPDMTDQERQTAMIDSVCSGDDSVQCSVDSDCSVGGVGICIGSDLHWVGSNAVAQGAGLIAGRHPSGHLEMYAPDPIEPGSSVSHFNTILFPDELMEPISTGSQNLDLTAAVLEDTGWTLLAGATTTSSTTTTSTTSTSSTLPAGLCGDADGNGLIQATDALIALRTAVGLDSCPLAVCDVNANGSVAATDALSILRKAVGLPETLTCS